MGRLRFNPNAAEFLNQHPEFVVNKVAVPEGKFFGIEIGMGKGGFLLENAIRFPNHFFLGIEKYPSVMVKALRKWLEQPVQNLKMLVGDASSLETIVPQHSVDVIYLNFSDPWPKARHVKRRLLHPIFLTKYAHVLKPDGWVIFKTDNKNFFRWFVEEIVPNEKIVVQKMTWDLPQGEENIETEYEKKFRSHGQQICQIIFRPL